MTEPSNVQPHSEDSATSLYWVPAQIAVHATSEEWALEVAQKVAAAINGPGGEIVRVVGWVATPELDAYRDALEYIAATPQEHPFPLTLEGCRKRARAVLASTGKTTP